MFGFPGNGRFLRANQQSDNGMNALAYALLGKACDKKVVSMFAACSGLNVNWSWQQKATGKSLMHLAIDQNREDCVSWLAKKREIEELN